MNTILKLLLDGNGKQFSVDFPIALQSILNFRNVGGEKSGKNAESFYYGFCLGLFLQARNLNCIVRNECSAGVGAFDCCILPPQNSGLHAVMMEFKILHGSETTEVAAQKGLEQITEKNYDSFIPQTATKLLKVGIAFEGNSCAVAFEKCIRQSPMTRWVVVAHNKSGTASRNRATRGRKVGSRKSSRINRQ
jgi:hypothetical protein